MLNMQELARVRVTPCLCGLSVQLSRSRPLRRQCIQRLWSRCLPAPRAMSQSNSLSSGKSYEDAVAALNSLQSNAAYIKSVKNEPLKTQGDRFLLIKRCSEMIGLGPRELAKLSVIHVAGTKGKGSTSAYCESILRHNGYKTGFYSSPHLVSVRERIQINGQPMSTQKFTTYFWRVYDLLLEKKGTEMVMPPYFAFLTLMAFRAFLEEQVEVAIVEVGIGGELDSTNILPNVSVVGITSLGIDHTAVLGNTLSSIAWQKAGILKSSAIGFTVPGHAPEAEKVLAERSFQRVCPVEISPPLHQYLWPDSQSKQAALSLFWTQQLNASLALQLSNAWMKRSSKLKSSNEMHTPSANLKEAVPFSVSRMTADGLFKCRWPGRNQILESNCGRITFYLDGAHTVESMEACVEWFSRSRLSSPDIQYALVFNMTGERDSLQIMEPLFGCAFDKVIFSPNTVSSSSPPELLNLRVPQNHQLKQTLALYDLWTSSTKRNDQKNKNMNGIPVATSKISVVNCVSEALEELSTGDTKWGVLVTGSLHLVGAVLSLIDPSLQKSVRS